jgi:prephenate dehydrogenase
VTGRGGFASVGIVGTGQVGTTIGMGLRAAPGVGEVLLHDRDEEVAGASLERGGGDRAVGLQEALASDAVVLALLVPQLPPFIESHAEDFRPGSLVMDTGSTKRSIVASMRRLPPAVHAIGGHPIAGTEHSGPSGARPGILRGAPFLLTPVRDDPEALAGGRFLAEATGARPIEMEADLHDRVLARVSHVPHLLAAALALSAARTDAPIGELASTGYHGVARLARSDPAMVGGFLSDNAEEVLAALDGFRDALDEMAKAVAGNLEDVEQALSAARDALEPS